MADLSEAERKLLAEIIEADSRGYPLRLDDTPERRSLKRRGFIVSETRSPYRKARSGTAWQWIPTPTGRAALTA